MTRWVWGYVWWGGVWIGVGFLAAELLGYYRVAPWPTFSSTVWHSERYPLVAPLVLATLLTLIVHFLYHKPLWASISFGVAVALAAHLVDRSWP